MPRKGINAHCPHCKKSISIVIDTDNSKNQEGVLRGRDLLNHLIEESGKKIKTIAKECGMIPNKISNMKNGMVGIGHKSAITFSEYFSHEKFEDFLTKRI